MFEKLPWNILFSDIITKKKWKKQYEKYNIILYMIGSIEVKT